MTPLSKSLGSRISKILAYTVATNTLVLASTNTCNSILVLIPNPQCLGILITFGSSNNPSNQTFQIVIYLSGTGLSQSKFSPHKAWSIVLALIVNGEFIPRVSYTVALSHKIKLLVQSR